MKTEITDEQRKLLDAKIPVDVISTREGGNGRKLSYLEGHYVIDRLNQIFGQGNWAWNTEQMTCVFNGPVENRGKTSFWANYVAKVTLVAGGTTFSNFGYGDGSDPVYPGKAHELAVKEAETDGLKRCAKNFGMSIGLALYDKSRENVDEGETEVQSKARTGNTGGVTALKPKGSKSTEVDTSAPASTAGSVAPKPTTLAGKAKDRNDVNMLLSAVAKSVISKKLFDGLPAVKAFMAEKYGTDAKEKLTDDQAVELLNYLDNINLNGVTANAG